MVAASIKGGPSGVRHDTNSDGDSRYYRNEAQEEERSEKGMSDRYYREPSYNSPTIGSPFDPKMFMRSAASTSFPDTRDSGPLSPPINYYRAAAPTIMDLGCTWTTILMSLSQDTNQMENSGRAHLFSCLECLKYCHTPEKRP
uniref:Uncharacterized protein n=1 Tax=Ditylenchus dipsaci TaxID=166011 RepID=A0A915CY86_9BILA